MELLWRSSPFTSAAQIPLKFTRQSPAGAIPLSITAEEYNRRENRRMKHQRIRKKLSGTTERPRLAVFRSNQHLYCQVIDDTKMHTLAAMSTIQKPLRDELNLSSGPTIEAAKRVGEEIAKLCLSKGITKIAFDRGGFEYHGRIKALAEAARESGLEF
ncbi:50S ribosomal protein L18, chloroplastic isoform X2 [Selaginella moellendorffii]|uniref:50S ribosomal protein L18, chloroplastic isoform X2 n=1 Tax=Selaginella moellendorffii TaxID=88036 RepID=UPI000D1C29F6|nr:50S ribosomal protein L18, chloroplastic isoform X2 [Selaginella moellendorffii]|eukprot:XP_024526848.1 50S ribosomal protein L18, chloroplastic isoform X2 [Selaginella moellendorffii]